jgi:adenosylcobinamide amidohydrolase
MTELATVDAAHGALSAVVGDRWLAVEWPEPQSVLSWAIVGGGRARARRVVWRRVGERELRPPVDARRFLRAEMTSAGYTDGVGLLTARRLDTAVDVTRYFGVLSARCVATVGLGNALAAGDPPGSAGRIGTINLVCHVSAPLSEEALVEALALASEARTAAVLASGVRSRTTGAPATGTGTDCLVIAAPEARRGAIYAGKHTAIGHLVGAAVCEAITRGAAIWLSEQVQDRHAVSS